MTTQNLALTAPGGFSDDQVLVDALPYLDTEYTEADRQMARRLIEQECKVFKPTKNYLKHLPVPDYEAFLTPALIQENARIAKKQEMPQLDMSRCELPSPAGTQRSSDKNAWKKSTRNAYAQNEHLLLRQINLELLEEFGPEVSRRWTEELQTQLTVLETKLREVKEQLMEVHANRKVTQLNAGKALKNLENSWVEMVTKNYRMEMNNQQMAEFIETQAKQLGVDLTKLNNQ
ncbi:unnamed protein product, partial [Mesorhabditis belari]|uniref:Pre-mRNA-splicing factor SPF27 n=1 Tax=Mesorhabditis belari TaxID=2138241 RepID=A0AAF3JB46_9BILA